MRKRSDMRAVQDRLVAEMKASLGVLIVLGMGGGKTACALTAAGDLIADGEIRAAMVLAPRKVAGKTWPDEIDKWEHLCGLSLGRVVGNPKQREKVMGETHDIYVCGIDNVEWLIKYLKKHPHHPCRDQLILDEMSKMKSPRGSRAKLLNRNQDMFGGFWGLTGTPRPNRWEEVWMPLQLISRGNAWGMAFDAWRIRHFEPLDRNGYAWSLRPEHKGAVLAVVNDWTVTIPPHETVDVPFTSGPEHDILVPMSKDQAIDAATMEKELMVELGLTGALADLDVEDERVVVALSQAVASGKLSQMMQGYIYDEGEAVHHYGDGKIAAAKEFVEELDGENLIITYWFKEDLAQLREAFPNLRVLGAGVTDKQANKTIDDWNAGKIPVLALHPASAGHGIELQFGGARMLIYSMPWSPELYVQMIKRIARSGQTLPVFVHRLITDHPYEHIRIRRVEGKINMEQDFVEELRQI